jgi:hypothetical protein
MLSPSCTRLVRRTMLMSVTLHRIVSKSFPMSEDQAKGEQTYKNPTANMLKTCQRFFLDMFSFFS